MSRVSGKKKNQIAEKMLGRMNREEWEIYEEHINKDVIKENSGHATQYKYDTNSIKVGLIAALINRLDKELQDTQISEQPIYNPEAICNQLKELKQPVYNLIELDKAINIIRKAGEQE